MQKRGSFSLLRKQRMPKGKELAQRAQDELRNRYKAKNIDPFESAYFKTYCDNLFDELLDIEFELYKVEEKKVNQELLWILVKDTLGSRRTATTGQLEQIIKGNFDVLRDFYLSISQSRKTRAGGSVQDHLAYMLSSLGYPFEEQKMINGKPDFILPNAELYKNNPGECVLVTAKRTLRERWRQIIIEGFKSPQYFLITIDEKQSTENLSEMAGHRIYLVVPERIKQSAPHYKDSGNVISLKGFFQGYLDPAMTRWRRAGIV